MTNAIRQSQMIYMESFDNLFIELSAKYCNQKCKMCYIDFPQFKKEQDFIDYQIIEKALKDTKNENIKCIYLTGAEPMTHPDFNAILRLCLKYCSVCICTNGSFINEKKARFLKKVEGESQNEIIFKISLDHYDEVKNDDIRYRGAFRQAVFAIKHLIKYGMTPIISVTNYYCEDENILTNKILEIFSSYELNTSNISVNPWYDKNSKKEPELNLNNIENCKLDCKHGRILSSKGVYSCPFLSNDYRGRCGSTFENYSKSTPLETDFCATCLASNHEIFSVNFES